MSLLDELRELQNQAKAELDSISGDVLEVWRIKYLGAKGAIKTVMQRLKEVPKDEKPAFGKVANEVKEALQAAFDARSAELSAAKSGAKGPQVDVTLPGRRPQVGHLHLITQTIYELCDIFGRMGFSVAHGPEVEDEWHNFEALNIPAAHPARDVLDNFYIDERCMLRSQTSTVQIRVMENCKPPVRIIAPGRVYRPDTVDARHFFMFHQLEGLYVAEGVTMSDLRTCLDQFCKAYFGPQINTRFKPSFFPFTEPSAEIDLTCPFCIGAGCIVCKTGRLELGGCGMVDPNVLASVGVDSEKYTGFAFGMGIERMIMLRGYNIPDIRLLFENNTNFLHQF